MIWLICWGCSRPVPYDCVVKPRFAEVESILAEERERFGSYNEDPLVWSD